MTIDAWLQAAIADAERRGLPDLKPVLETLAKATTALRAADFNQAAVDSRQSKVESRKSAAESSDQSSDDSRRNQSSVDSR